MVAASMVTTTLESSGPSPMWITPLPWRNRPRIRVTTKCRASKARLVWSGSMIQSPARGTTAPSTVRVAGPGGGGWGTGSGRS